VERNRLGVLYLGVSLNVCFLETLVRDRRDGTVDDLIIAEAELDTRSYAETEVVTALSLVDLRGNGPVRMGVPSDVIGSAPQTLARRWSLAFYNHPSQPDGIIYPSRLNEETSLAVYDRSVIKLSIAATTGLRNAPGLAHVLNNLNTALG
jgi:hypothetical protein